MSTTRRNLASRSRGFRGEGVAAAEMSARAGTGAPGTLRSGDPGGVRTIALSEAARLAAKVVLVGLICHVSTQIGFAHKIPPHQISALWPTTAILFSVLVVSPVRHWWAYTLAAYASSIVNDIRAGFPASAGLFIAAGILEIAAAAAGVRRFADGVRAFLSLRSLVAYVLIAVILAPSISAFIAAFAGSGGHYWFYWRVWALSEALAFLMLAPAILTWIRFVRDRIASGESLARAGSKPASSVAA